MSSKDSQKGNPFVAMVDCRPRTEDNAARSIVPSSLLDIKDPCTGEKRQYLTTKSKKRKPSVFEIQSLPHPRSDDYSAFFVQSRVISNPHMHMVTPVDPLYLLLPYFTSQEKWQPFDQLIQSKQIPSEQIDCLDMKQLKHLFEVNDAYGDDLILYRFSKEKTMTWLQKKLNKVQEFLKAQFLLKQQRKVVDERNTGGAFNSSFNLGGSDDSTQEEKNECDDVQCRIDTDDERQIKYYAVQIICEYLSDFWRKEFLTAQAMDESTLGLKKSTKAKSETQSKEVKPEVTSTSSINSSSDNQLFSNPAMSEADKLMHYTMGSGESNTEEQKTKKRKEAPKSVGLKSLSKVNTKGMKSMKSFFSAKPKAKKAK